MVGTDAFFLAAAPVGGGVVCSTGDKEELAEASRDTPRDRPRPGL